MKADELKNALEAVRVVPVIDPKCQDQCLSAVDALVAGGATTIEITLRSELAIDTLRACRLRHPDIILGAGSVMDPMTYDIAVEAGADFTISPGRCSDLESYTAGKNVAHVPGVVTPSEIIEARKSGQRLLKFYPSEAAGGASALKDLGRIFPDVMMMPSGGIKRSMLAGYSSLPGVLSVGGSWMYADGGEYLGPEEIREAMTSSIEEMRRL
ncbi:bifunctional 4-hydroxy-2-oxoglutarate aldolase/2-dehydro-3-deoxy-phosphogluconate aldolase [Salipiger mangrovisoli]|uniref:Bifunctional 4-hydroxy-2-oxoglutarate aldolase/2-dehydro-3-deoxy-phosphogluconate aldolase n=1 Tax=Salipiger mangrovisoli TaxID=2865933 RepID=A0ABR9XA26_9RHOB|nr:bifunctional 4-hydroxy-2-oxoglutarate aldolase/2-dehydro-3-deoxy-phosphogluconate aldolase [Salipiger mangrovisoli]MBE9640464.1 bifunctional 4-hydroxy-2-oxoglutarate aldolase/2-dehydro-3-deoxy-phosphogluconate aldolase [Salipiger mangrovisoli]